MTISTYIQQRKKLLCLLTAYFLLHLTNLTLLPIFNDEAIYLDWAWIATRLPGHLYDSLADSKQPFMLWLFGIAEVFFHNPLFAGRFVGIVFGTFTVLGIYSIGKLLGNGRVAIIAAVVYSVTPIFVFYNRQALMEPAIACAGIWTFYLVLRMLHKPTTHLGILLGTILGIGFFIKTSMLLFIVATICVVGYRSFKEKHYVLLKVGGIALLTFICVDSLIFINPDFWNTFHTNDRYVYTLQELLAFPLTGWVKNSIGWFIISFIFLTPFTFLFSLLGTCIMKKQRVKDTAIFLLFFLLGLLLQIVTVKGQSQRYLVPFLPFLVIPFSYAINNIWSKKYWGKVVTTVSVGIPLSLSVLLLVAPDMYIRQMANFSSYADTAYIYGQTSGYGVTDAMQFIIEHANAKQNLVVTAWNVGNPENAIDIYAKQHENLFVFPIDQRFFTDLSQYRCFTSAYPVFFVTRSVEMAGFEKYFSPSFIYKNPYNDYSVRVYTLKHTCTGPSLSLSDIYQEKIQHMLDIRTGKSEE